VGNPATFLFSIDTPHFVPKQPCLLYPRSELKRGSDPSRRSLSRFGHLAPDQMCNARRASVSQKQGALGSVVLSKEALDVLYWAWDEGIRIPEDRPQWNNLQQALGNSFWWSKMMRILATSSGFF